MQSETEIAGAKANDKTSTGCAFTITEIERKPSSCPYLYTWNGERFEFITDFMGGGEMGNWSGPGVYSFPDPDEYVRIRDAAQSLIEEKASKTERAEQLADLVGRVSAKLDPSAWPDTLS